MEQESQENQFLFILNYKERSVSIFMAIEIWSSGDVRFCGICSCRTWTRGHRCGQKWYPLTGIPVANRNSTFQPSSWASVLLRSLRNCCAGGCSVVTKFCRGGMPSAERVGRSAKIALSRDTAEISLSEQQRRFFCKLNRLLRSYHHPFSRNLIYQFSIKLPAALAWQRL